MKTKNLGVSIFVFLFCVLVGLNSINLVLGHSYSTAEILANGLIAFSLILGIITNARRRED